MLLYFEFQKIIKYDYTYSKFVSKLFDDLIPIHIRDDIL